MNRVVYLLAHTWGAWTPYGSPIYAFVEEAAAERARRSMPTTRVLAVPVLGDTRD